MHHLGLTMAHQCDITDEFEKLSIPPEENLMIPIAFFHFLNPKFGTQSRKSARVKSVQTMIQYLIIYLKSNVDKPLIISE